MVGQLDLQCPCTTTWLSSNKNTPKTWPVKLAQRTAQRTVNGLKILSRSYWDVKQSDQPGTEVGIFVFHFFLPLHSSVHYDIWLYSKYPSTSYKVKGNISHLPLTYFRGCILWTTPIYWSYLSQKICRLLNSTTYTSTNACSNDYLKNPLILVSVSSGGSRNFKHRQRGAVVDKVKRWCEIRMRSAQAHYVWQCVQSSDHMVFHLDFFGFSSRRLWFLITTLWID